MGTEATMLAKALRSCARGLHTRVTLIPGDGIGPEVMAMTRDVVAAAEAPIVFDEQPITTEVANDDALLDEVEQSLRKNKVCLTAHILAGRRNNAKLTTQMQLNRDLDVFAHVSHVHSYEGITRTKHKISILLLSERLPRANISLKS